MPRGMLVRSAWSASSLSDPRETSTLDAYEAAQRGPFERPLPGEELPRYGHWFQERAVGEVDERRVAAVESRDGGFEVLTEDGEAHSATRVVIATGLASFPYRPPTFAELGETHATHSMDVSDPGCFSGQTVAVIGCGQSAVETAALLVEAGAAEVQLIARAAEIRWLIRGEQLRGIDPFLQRLLYAPTDVGPAGVSRLVAKPNAFRRLPRGLQDRLAYRSIRPAATSWLLDRTATVSKTFNREVVRAQTDGAQVGLELDDGSQRTLDHVVLATGYRVNVANEPIVGDSLRKGLRLHGGYPVLGRGFESSVPGLHFLGAYSAWSFGPIMRFVAGTKFTARELARHVERSVTATSAGRPASPAPVRDPEPATQD